MAQAEGLGQRVFLLALLDDHSRFVTGWALDDAERADAVISAFEGAVALLLAGSELTSHLGQDHTSAHEHPEDHVHDQPARPHPGASNKILD